MVYKMKDEEPPAPWNGWYFDKDLLVSPEGLRFSVNQVRAVHFTEQLIHALRQQRQLEFLW